MKVSVVIPVFNEVGNLSILQQRLNAVLQKLSLDYEIIYVDDGSFDASPDELERLYREYQNVKVITLTGNYGQTQALAAGIDITTGEVVVTLDADLQNDPSDIPAILAKLEEGYDVVSGWRVKRKDNLFSKRIPSYVANSISSLITNVRLHDLGCSLKGYKRNVLERIEFYSGIHRFLPLCAVINGAKITEISVKHHPRLHGKTKYGISRIFKVILDMFTIILMWKFASRPISVLGKLGITCLCLSGLLGVFIVIRKLSYGGVWVSPLLFIFVIFFVLGTQFILMGMLAELVINVNYGNRNQKRYRVKKVLGNGNL